MEQNLTKTLKKIRTYNDTNTKLKQYIKENNIESIEKDVKEEIIFTKDWKQPEWEKVRKELETKQEHFLTSLTTTQLEEYKEIQDLTTLINLASNELNSKR